MGRSKSRTATAIAATETVAMKIAGKRYSVSLLKNFIFSYIELIVGIYTGTVFVGTVLLLKGKQPEPHIDVLIIGTLFFIFSLSVSLGEYFKK